jgi:hypothetical protein
LASWTQTTNGEIGITNYDALDEDVDTGSLGALILDESSMLKSHYGKWGQDCIRIGRGLDWKLCLTGTPAPNDRIEYANHAVFLDHYPTVNSFLARFFVNRGKTDERWELKPHALRPFYEALSHWCIFVSNPAVYGWKDNSLFRRSSTSSPADQGSESDRRYAGRDFVSGIRHRRTGRWDGCQGDYEVRRSSR